MRSYDLAHTSKSEILLELASQGVTDVHHIEITKEGLRKKTNTIILTFGLSAVPKDITAGYMKIAVQTYYPSPLRCFNCQRFGHHRAACKHDAICALCGMPHHDDAACTNPKCCTNCKGAHAAFDKACPRWQKETAIVKEKTDKNISFEEARKLVEARSVPAPGITYAAVVKSSKSISTQTDVVNCTCHCRAEVVQPQPGISSASIEIQTDSVAPCVIADITKVARSTVTPAAAASTVHKTISSNNKQPTQQTATINNNKLSPNKNNQSAPKNAASKNAPPAGGSPGAGLRGVRGSGGAAGGSSRDTGSNPDRVPKGSGDPIRLYNRYGSLESMDAIDDVDIPSNGGKSSSSSPKLK